MGGGNAAANGNMVGNGNAMGSGNGMGVANAMNKGGTANADSDADKANTGVDNTINGTSEDDAATAADDSGEEQCEGEIGSTSGNASMSKTLATVIFTCRNPRCRRQDLHRRR